MFPYSALNHHSGFPALSLNGYRPPHCDRHLMVKYAEDQHKKKDRRSQLLVGPMGSNMMENSYSSEGHMNPDARDVPYLYSRGRGSQPGMYRPQQSSAQMNLMNQGQQGNQNFSSSSNANYLSRESGKGASPSMSPSSVSNINSSDWYSHGQTFQVHYDNQMGNPPAHMNNHQGQSLSYDQHAMEQQMMSQGQRSSNNQGQSQGQGTLYTRPNRVTNESGYNGAVAIIISFLPQHADVALLHDLCAPYGRIVSAQIDIDNSSISPEESSALGGCTGRGRVKLSTMSQAQYATQALNGAIIFEGGRPLRVSVQFT